MKGFKLAEFGKNVTCCGTRQNNLSLQLPCVLSVRRWLFLLVCLSIMGWELTQGAPHQFCSSGTGWKLQATIPARVLAAQGWMRQTRTPHHRREHLGEPGGGHRRKETPRQTRTPRRRRERRGKPAAFNKLGLKSAGRQRACCSPSTAVGREHQLLFPLCLLQWSLVLLATVIGKMFWDTKC